MCQRSISSQKNSVDGGRILRSIPPCKNDRNMFRILVLMDGKQSEKIGKLNFHNYLDIKETKDPATCTRRLDKTETSYIIRKRI